MICLSRVQIHIMTWFCHLLRFDCLLNTISKSHLSTLSTSSVWLCVACTIKFRLFYLVFFLTAPPSPSSSSSFLSFRIVRRNLVSPATITKYLPHGLWRAKKGIYFSDVLLSCCSRRRVDRFSFLAREADFSPIFPVSY